VTLRSLDGLGAEDERETFAAGAGRLAGRVPRLLGWQPGEFWQATPAELAAILGDGRTAPAPLSRTELTDLMERERDG
jgi:uncharacterized phage protein (TIGR02216 family)